MRIILISIDQEKKYFFVKVKLVLLNYFQCSLNQAYN